jgi:hypothetical protein
MPTNKDLYPPDWEEISTRIKAATGWVCQECGKQCYLPGEPCADRTMVLTVHHLDHNPVNCAEDNLIALCAPCHLRADANHHARNARRTRASKSGQMWLSKEIRAI